MKNLGRFLWAVLFSFIFNACDNSIDITGPYEENVAVFGLLDPTQDIQYIKINKVFTNPNSSAAQIAQQSDSLYFDSLAPFLIEVETGRRIPLYKINYLPKAPGLFTTSVNYLYATKEKIYANNPANQYEFYHYRLEILLPSQKRMVHAITDVPDSTILLAPISMTFFNKEMEFTPGTLRVSFQGPANAKIFDAYFYFNYLEVNKKDTMIKVAKSLKLGMVNKYRVFDANERESVSVGIDGNFFYEALLLRLKADTSVFRRLLPCRFELTNANLEFDNYMSVAEPSIGIVQKQTDYSNIVNGVGLFASRRVSRYNSIQLGPYTRDQLTRQAEYKKLGFVKD